MAAHVVEAIVLAAAEDTLQEVDGEFEATDEHHGGQHDCPRRVASCPAEG